MNHIKTNRYAAILFLSASCYLGLMTEQASAQVKEPKLTPAEAKRLIPAAASISNKDFNDMLSKAGALDFKKMDSQSLSSVFLSIATKPEPESDGSKPHFSYLAKTLDPVDIVRAIWATKSKGYATFVQPRFITKCTTKTEKGIASGTVEFTAEDLYSGQALFTARFIDGSWKITQFSLPNNNMKIVLNKDNKWKVEPLDSNKQ